MVASCHVKDALSAMTMLFFGLVVLVNIGIRADSSQRDLTRSRAELNAVTHADHMKDDIVRGIDITNTLNKLLLVKTEKMKILLKIFVPNIVQRCDVKR